MVTSFDSRSEIDESAVLQVVEHLLANGTTGLVVCGTTGESPTLTHEEKLRMFRLVKKAAGDRVPIIAGTGTNSTADSVTLSKQAHDIGVDGLLLVNKPSQEGLYRHFRAIAESVPCPCMPYNVPPRTSVNIEAATILRLAQDVPNIVAIKEASGNLIQISEIEEGMPPGFRIYSGDDGLVLPMLAVGCHGVVSVTSHLVGSGLAQMHEAFFAGRIEEAAQVHAKMLPIVKACFQPTTPSPAPVKAGLNMLGIPAGPLRLPLVDVNDSEAAVLRRAMQQYGLL